MSVFLQQRPVQIFLLLSLYMLLGSYLPCSWHQLFYAVSLLIKDLLLWMMPITVGLFIAHAIASFERKALWFVVTLLLFECISNWSSVWFAYLGGHLATNALPALALIGAEEPFEPLFRCPFLKPVWWSADKGSFVGLGLGCLAALQKRTFLHRMISQGKSGVEWVLTRIFARLIPLFALGFVARMAKTHLLEQVAAYSTVLLIWLLGLLFVYMALLFWVGSGGSLRGAVRSARHLSPAAGLAFSSGCSLSTMPWTIQGTAKNLRDPGLAQAVIPATTNIQQIGDCLINAFLCFLIYRHFYGQNPDLGIWF